MIFLDAEDAGIILCDERAKGLTPAAHDLLKTAAAGDCCLLDDCGWPLASDAQIIQAVQADIDNARRQFLTCNIAALRGLTTPDELLER